MIYFLDMNPEKCAEYYCDAHVVIEIEDLTLMLSNCHDNYGSFNEESMPKSTNHTDYRWIKRSKSNYEYIAKLAYALCRQFEARYNQRYHLANVIDEFFISIPKMGDFGLTLFPTPPGTVVGVDRSEDSVMFHRQYYSEEKCLIAAWRYGNAPEWYPEDALLECIAKTDVTIKRYAYERIKHLFPEQKPIVK